MSFEEGISCIIILYGVHRFILKIHDYFKSFITKGYYTNYLSIIQYFLIFANIFDVFRLERFY